MFRFDFPIDDADVQGMLGRIGESVEEIGIADTLRELEDRSRGLSNDVGAARGFNLVPSEDRGVCTRLVVGMAAGGRGMGSRQGSPAVLDGLIRHLAACGASVDGRPPDREVTRIVAFFHRELDIRTFESRYRPTLEAFQSRGVRILMLHVDTRNRITWIERDLADGPRAAHGNPAAH